MISRIWRSVFLRPFTTARAVALLALTTAGAALLWAHEGHQALPTRGATLTRDEAGRVNGVILAAEARTALDVRLAEVAPVALEDRVAAPATVVAPWQRHAFVTARLGGKVAAVRVRPGDPVSPDQTLVEVESLELVDLQRELLDARNEAGLSGKNLEGLEAGYRGGSVAEKTLHEARAAHRQDLDALDIARAKLRALGVPGPALERLLKDAAPRPLRTLPVRSPIAGVVDHIDVAVGQVIEPAQHLLEVVDTSRVWVRVAVLEKDLHRVRAGQAVSVRLPAAPGPGPDGVWLCAVQVKGHYLDPQTHLGTVWAELDNPQGRARPGMAGQASVHIPAARKGLLVPADALAGEGAERFVLVELATGQYRRQNVVVEGQRGDDVQVSRTTGLYPGDRVVTAGSHELASFFAQGVLRLSPEAERASGLRVEPAGRRPVAEVVTLPAVVDLPPSGRAVVTSRLAGTLRRIAVDRDQAVKAGDLLAEVDSLELHAAQLDLLRSDRQARLLDETLKRLRPLGGGAVSARAVREAESALVATRQRRDGLRRKLRDIGLSGEQLQGLLEKRKLVDAVPVRAPIGGVVVRFRAALGQAVKAEEPLFEVHDLSAPVLRVHVPERHLPALRLGQRGRVRLVADPGFVGEAVLDRSASSVGEGGRTVAVWATLKAVPKTPLLLWMMARLSLVLSESSPTLAVPVDAVLRDGAAAYLFVRRADGTFERRPVQTGRADDRLVEVVAGLAEGEPVAVRGVADLQNAYASLR